LRLHPDESGNQNKAQNQPFLHGILLSI